MGQREEYEEQQNLVDADKRMLDWRAKQAEEAKLEEAQMRKRPRAVAYSRGGPVPHVANKLLKAHKTK